MKICKYHPDIAYSDEYRDCPICELETKIRELESINEIANEEIGNLESLINETKGV